MKAFAPYLSQALLRSFNEARACYNDSLQKNVKPEVSWVKLGLFSGRDAETAPQSFIVERTKPQQDSSFLVFVTVFLGDPGSFFVDAIVRRENGHYVVDDVIYGTDFARSNALTDYRRSDTARLSQYLSAGCSSQPLALVQSLYTQVVARHPHGIPEGEDMKIFTPYLSKALLHRIGLARACSADWGRHNPEQSTTEMASAYGLFSGEGADAEPQAFQIERAQSLKDGFTRVYVDLTAGKPPEREWSWSVAPVVVREDGHDVIDDVVYVNGATYANDEDRPADRRLSEYLSAGCDGPRWSGYRLPTQPEALVRSLYQQVVARTPGGIPSGADWKIFAPYMSKTLLHRIDVFNACVADYFRQHSDPNVKAPFGVFESGIFSGADERTGPRTFHIERTESEKDGSFRVDVKLTYGPSDGPGSWHVAPLLVRENGRLVVDDVVFIKDELPIYPPGVDWRLSQSLSSGCDGPHFVGYHDEQNDPKPQK
jgi:hypothetical protein